MHDRWWRAILRRRQAVAIRKRICPFSTTASATTRMELSLATPLTTYPSLAALSLLPKSGVSLMISSMLKRYSRLIDSFVVPSCWNGQPFDLANPYGHVKYPIIGAGLTGPNCACSPPWVPFAFPDFQVFSIPKVRLATNVGFPASWWKHSISAMEPMAGCNGIRDPAMNSAETVISLLRISWPMVILLDMACSMSHIVYASTSLY